MSQHRNTMVLRQWQLLLALQDTPRTVGELARLCSTTIRTIYRDLDALQAARFSLYPDRDDDGAVRWRLLQAPPLIQIAQGGR